MSLNKSALDWLKARDYGPLCPACGYDLGVAAWDSAIPSGRTCPSCGIKFGTDDTSARIVTYLLWRDMWIDRHMPWSDAHTSPPAGWDPVIQMRRVGENLGSSYPTWLASLPPPQTPENTPYWYKQAAHRLAEVEHAPVAIEAFWDGDTKGWFVVLCATIEEPSLLHPRYTEVSLISLRGPGGDIRLFSGVVPPWPEAQMAAEIGQALAQQRGVPFYFYDPTEPDDQAPRWWDTPAPDRR